MPFFRDIDHTYVATTRARSSVKFIGPPRGFIANVCDLSLIASADTPRMIVATISSNVPLLWIHGPATKLGPRGVPRPPTAWHRQHAPLLNNESPSATTAGVISLADGPARLAAGVLTATDMRGSAAFVTARWHAVNASEAKQTETTDRQRERYGISCFDGGREVIERPTYGRCASMPDCARLA